MVALLDATSLTCCCTLDVLNTCQVPWQIILKSEEKGHFLAHGQVFSRLVNSSHSCNTSMSPFLLGRICSLTAFWQVSELPCTRDEPLDWAGSNGLDICKNFPSGVCGQQERNWKLFLQNKEWFICPNRHSTPKNRLRKREESYANTILPILGISLKHLFLLWFLLADPIRDCAVQTLTLS